MSPQRVRRYAFLAEAKNQLGKPYIWGAKGPQTFDCSGLVTHSVDSIGGPDLRETHNAQRLLGLCFAQGRVQFTKGKAEPELEILPGSLLFYGVGPQAVSHVMIALGDGTALGASGGGPNTTVPKAGAAVKIQPSINYRPDLVAVGELPFFLDEKE